MRAVLMQHPLGPSSALLPVAGQPLIARQLEWLREQRVEQIAVEISHGSVIDGWLDKHAALGEHVTRVRAGKYQRPDDVAAQAGFGSEPYVVVYGDLLAHVDLAALVAEHGPGTLLVALPSRGDLLRGMIRIVDPRGPLRQVSHARGWGCFVLNRREALDLSAMVLRGCTDDLLVHGAEVQPGVWCARGATIERGAIVYPGVLLGPGAVITAGAIVGPDVDVGANTVIEAGARLSATVVDPDLIVGAIEVTDGRVGAAGVHHLQSDELLHPISDSRLIATRKLLRRVA